MSNNHYCLPRNLIDTWYAHIWYKLTILSISYYPRNDTKNECRRAHERRFFVFRVLCNILQVVVRLQYYRRIIIIDATSGKSMTKQDLKSKSNFGQYRIIRHSIFAFVGLYTVPFVVGSPETLLERHREAIEALQMPRANMAKATVVHLSARTTIVAVCYHNSSILVNSSDTSTW